MVPGIHVSLTVSPVRHWRDGAAANQRSKAVLHILAHNLEDKFDFVYYFPAYEIVNDDLRDYRWYASDMLHPTDDATNYVWNKFGDTYFRKETQELNQNIEKVKRAVNHRPFIPESKHYKDFIRNQENYVTSLKERYPYIGFDQELSFFKNQS